MFIFEWIDEGMPVECMSVDDIIDTVSGHFICFKNISLMSSKNKTNNA